MRDSRSFPNCSVCGKSRGYRRDHTQCSRILKARNEGKAQPRKSRKGWQGVDRLMRHLAFSIKKPGETPAYLETGVDYRAVERIKSGGQG